MEGDFRYVDLGAFDECTDFLEYFDDHRENWEKAFVGWIGVSKSLKEDRKMSQNYWSPLNILKVLSAYMIPIVIVFYPKNLFSLDDQAQDGL